MFGSLTKFTNAIGTKDPQQVLSSIEKYRNRITRDPDYVPQLVRVLRDFQTNLKINESVLNLISISVHSLDSFDYFIGDNEKYIYALLEKGCLKQIIENMSNFLDVLNIASLALTILEESSRYKYCDTFFSDKKTLENISMTMTIHKKSYTKVCSKGIQLLLNILSRNEDNTWFSDDLGSVGAISTLVLLIQNAFYNKKDPSKSIQILSHLNLSDDSFRDCEEQIKKCVIRDF